MALSRVAYANTPGTAGTFGAETTASFTWLTGDLFIAMNMNEIANGVPTGTPTFGGGTFTAITGGPYGNTATNCYGQMWQCTVAAGGSGVVTDPAESSRSHICLVWQFRGHNGIGGHNGLASTALVVSNTNTGTNSWVCSAWADFGAGASGRTGTPTVTNKVIDTAFSTNYSVWGGDWSGQSGTVSYGVTTSGGGALTKMVVEVLEAGGATPRPYQSRRDTRPALTRSTVW